MYEVTCTKPGGPVLVVAGPMSKYDATQFAVKFFGTRAARGKCVTIRPCGEMT